MVLALLTIYKAQKQWNDQNGKAACYVTRVKMFLSTAWRRKKQHNKPTHWLFGASEFKWAGFHEIKVEKNKQNKNQEVLNTACCVCNNKGREREERQLLSEYKKKQLGTPKLGNKLEKKLSWKNIKKGRFEGRLDIQKRRAVMDRWQRELTSYTRCTITYDTN